MTTYIIHPTTRLFEIILNILPDKKAFPILKFPENIERITRTDPSRKVVLEVA
jgi:hypothetical protein